MGLSIIQVNEWHIQPAIAGPSPAGLPCLGGWFLQASGLHNQAVSERASLGCFCPPRGLALVTCVVSLVVTEQRAGWQGDSPALTPRAQLREGYLVDPANNLELIAGPRGGDVSFECLPYQLSMVLFVPTMVTTGNGESGFDSGEGA
ncbi:unnamed protein product [Pleuronectes platessa]|uniref:Uncharacterized protein n=1 Tax=Pleuronectes platessa TaxID=8262 RepID=A0A9N7VTD7_PLEPL|nr:unnamed protein product [Pleuronectes platessa]